MGFEDVANGALKDIETQFQQFAGDLAVTPAGILVGQLYDRIIQLLADGRSAAGIDRFLFPFVAHEFSMPVDHGFRFEDTEDTIQLTGREVASLFQRRCQHGRRPFLLAAGPECVVLFVGEHIQLLADCGIESSFRLHFHQ